MIREKASISTGEGASAEEARKSHQEEEKLARHKSGLDWILGGGRLRATINRMGESFSRRVKKKKRYGLIFTAKERG